MKRILLYLFFVTVLAVYSFGYTNVQMEEYNGVYRVPCTVNGARMKFIFDTGASNVSLSVAMAQYLYDNDYLKDEDFIGVGTSTIADGKIVPHLVVNLRDIEIGGVHLCDVQANIVESSNAPLLLGQSAIKKLGGYGIAGNTLTIYTKEELNNLQNTAYVDTITEEFINIVEEGDTTVIADTVAIEDARAEIDLLCGKLYDYYNGKAYTKACEVAQQLFNLGELSGQELAIWAQSLYNSEKFEDALNVLDLITDYSWYTEGNGIIDPLSMRGNIYAQLGNYKEAIDSHLESLITFKQNYFNTASAYMVIGGLYGGLEDYQKSIEYYKLALKNYAAGRKMTYDQLWLELTSMKHPIRKKNVDDLTGAILHGLSLSYNKSFLWSDEEYEKYMKIFARKGFEFAIKYCNMNSLKY